MKPTTVDEYLSHFDGAASVTLHRLREVIRECVLGAVECLKWGKPAYVGRTSWFQFSGHKAHASFSVTPSTLDHFRSQLGELKAGNSAAQMPEGEPNLEELPRAMITYRVDGYEDQYIY